LSFEDKASFLNASEKALSTEITAHDLNNVLRILSDVLQGYDVTQLPTGEAVKDDLLECYIASQKVRGLSGKTLERYEYVIRRLMESLQVPTRQVTVYHLRGWLAKEQSRGLSDVTLRGLRDVFCAYFGWLHREGLIERDPTGNLDPIKCAKKRKQIYSPIDIEKLNEMCGKMRYSIRNRALVSFLRSTGCRISEVTELNRDDINLQTLEVVVTGKGDKQRKVYMDEVSGMLLKAYLESRKDNNEALFAGARGERLMPNGVRAMLKDLAKLAGVEHVHPHKFRRTLATNLNRRGMPIQEVAAILGHEKLDTTMKYVVLNDSDLKSDYRKFT
jgi:site-specific recombinase XerD